MKLQAFGLILLLMILGEFIQTRDAYKSIRPYKYYRPRGRGHRHVGWHPFPRPSRHRHYKKGPSKSRYRRPSNTWHAPRYAVDHVSDEQPYTIEIELPKRQRSPSWRNYPHQRNYDRGTVQDYYNDDDYLDEDEEFEERVMQTGRKKVRVKVVKGVKPKLRIKISRNDNLKDIAKAANFTLRENILKRDSSMSLKELGQMVDGQWMPLQPIPSFPEALRGA